MKLLKVAEWEFLKIAKSKQFLVMTVIIPLLLGAFGGVPILIERLTGDRAREIAVLDETGAIYPELSRRLEGTPLRLVAATGDRDALLERLEAGELDGLLVIGRDVDETNAVSLYTRGLKGLVLDELKEALTQVLSERRLARAGYDPEEIAALTEEVRVSTIVLGTEGRTLADMAVPFGLAILLMIGAMFSGGMLFYSVIKEKTGRVVEIMLSSVSARELMMGKILGYGATSLLQIAVWGGIAFVIANHYLGISLAALTGVQLSTYPLYFILGYLLIATIYAILGAGMKDAQSGSQLQGFATILPIIPIMLVGVIIEQPDLGWVRAFSFIPPFTPATMMLRMALTRVPWWEVLASLVILVLFVYLLMRFAAKVFEVGILMYGKSATLGEIWRWGIRPSKEREWRG
jgi:ABC-2 type transport system permease protein